MLPCVHPTLNLVHSVPQTVPPVLFRRVHPAGEQEVRRHDRRVPQDLPVRGRARTVQGGWCGPERLLRRKSCEIPKSRLSVMKLAAQIFALSHIIDILLNSLL